MTKEEAANCKEAAMPVESEAEYLVWSKVTRNLCTVKVYRGLQGG